jgi:hypothetical protein
MFPVIKIKANDLQGGDYIRDEGVVSLVLRLGRSMMFVHIGDKSRMMSSDEHVFVHIEDNGID